MSISSESQYITAVSLNVKSGVPLTTVTQIFNDPRTIASLRIDQPNSIEITDQAILALFATPGLQCSNTLSIQYSGLVSAVSETASDVSNFVATPIVLSNFGPFNLNFVSNGTFTLQPPTCNNPSLTNFSYTIDDTTIATVGLTSGVVTLLSAGTTTIRASLPAENGYAEASIPARFVIIPIAPTFSNNNSSTFTIPNKNVGDAPFPPSYPTSNSLGEFTYTSNNHSVATVNATGLVTIVGEGTATITALQAAYGGYTSRPATGNVTVTVLQQKGFSQVTDSAFTNLNFDSGMTTLFTVQDSISSLISMPNNNFKFGGAPYSVVYLSSEGALYFNTKQAEYSYGTNNQLPVSSFRFFGHDHMSTGSYKFDTNNTRLLVKLTGYDYGYPSKTFTIKVIIEQSGNITTNYTLASTYNSDQIIIGYVGSISGTTSDDIFLTLDGVTFNGTTSVNLFSLLNGKTILFIPYILPSLGPFTLPSDINIYMNQTITRQLTPPTSNSSGAFTYTSSNAAVATIIVDSQGASSINVIGFGTTTITVLQAASGEFSFSGTSAILFVTRLYSTFGPFTLAGGLIYTGTTITRVITAPSSNSLGAFTFSSSNLNVATIIVDSQSASSINVIGPGTVTITATQAASGNISISTTSALLNTTNGVVTGFSQVTDSAFTNLDFDSGMTQLFSLVDSRNVPINMPNTSFMFGGNPYSVVYLSSEGALYFNTQQAEYSYGTNNQIPVSSFRFFGHDHMSIGSYKFDINNTRLLVKLTGYDFGYPSKTFTIKVIIEQSGNITTNYTLASTYISDRIIIGYIGSNSAITSDDIFLTLDGVTFNGTTYVNLFSLLNGKTIAYGVGLSPTFGSFTLPSGLTTYQNQTITKTLTAPSSSNTSGAFTFTSSNLNVATITGSNGVFSINVIGPGTTTIAATQAASDGYSISSVTATLVVTVTYPTWSTAFTLPSDLNLYQGQPITKTLTVPTSIDSSGAFTFSSSNLNVATITVSGGISSINVIGPGTVTITATQAPSGIYYSLSQAVTFDVISITLDPSNGKTIKCAGNISTPIYIIQASPRGPLEWFAIVNQQAKTSITSYARGDAAGIAAFTKVISSNESVEVPFNNIVTSLMTDMNSLFNGATAFNSDISSWDTSSVINMTAMFNGVISFNQNIGYWNTSKVTTMFNMFSGTQVFNNGGFATINNWDTSSVTGISGMFQNAEKFNQPIGKWNTSKVTNMFAMFQGASEFNQDIGYNSSVSTTAWDTSKVTSMDYMFSSASAFNNGGSPSIGNWNTFLVDSMFGMFQGASAFNQDIGYYPSVSTTAWNTSKVTQMGYMFFGASVFNNGGSTNVGIDNWLTSNVVYMDYMFKGATAFNKPIGNWNTSKVTNMNSMFLSASVFNQDISKWIVISVKPKPPPQFSDGSNLSTPYMPNWYGGLMYTNSNPTIPSLSLANFPRLGAITNWELSINFNVSGGTNTWRALIGDMYNTINSRGWGVWVSNSNSIFFSWNVNTWNTNFTVSTNTNYVLKITRTPASLTFLLTDVATNATQTATNTAMSDINTYVMSTNGPVTIGGWISYSSENFPGTISYVGVINPDVSITTFAAPTSLRSRYDASVASSYILSGNDVTQWNDLTGNGYNLTPNGTGPTVSIINSVPALNFNSVRGLICSSVPLVTPITIFMVAKYSTLIGGYGNFMHHGDRDLDWSLERDGSTTNIKFESNNVNNCVIAATNNTNYIWVGRIVGNIRQFSMYSDTVAPKYISGTPVTIVPGNKALYVGKSNSGEGCNSSIGEILYYNTSLSDADVTQNVAYLQNKWFNYIV